MTRSRSSTFLLIVFLALGGAGAAAAWFALADDVTPPGLVLEVDAVDRPQVEIENADGTNSRLVDVEPERSDFVAGETSVAFPLEVELRLVQRGTFEQEEGLPPIGSGADARLRGSIYAEDGSGMRATVKLIGGPNEGRVLQCDKDGAYGAFDLYPGLAIVRVETPRGHVAEREIRLRRHAEEICTIGFGQPASIYGEVTTRDGHPIEGAEVRISGHETISDEKGEFYLPRVASGKALAVVSKPGYALYRETVPVPRGRVVTKDRLSFRLSPGATLEVTVLENVGAREPAKLFILPAGGQRVNMDRGQRTFPWHLVNPVEIFPGASAVVDDLPDGRVNLRLFHSGAVANPRQTAIRLVGGSKRQAVLHLEPTQQLRGKVLREGAPVAGAKVMLEAPNRFDATVGALGANPEFAQGMILGHVPSAVQSVRSDSRGAFVFTSYAAVTSTYYLSAETTDGAWHANRVVRADETDIEVELEPTLTREAQLRIRLAGRHQGLPVEVTVNGAPRDSFELAPEDDLWLGDLAPGRWVIDVNWHGEPVLRSQSLKLDETEELHLVLPDGALHGQTEEERKRAGR